MLSLATILRATNELFLIVSTDLSISNASFSWLSCCWLISLFISTFSMSPEFQISIKIYFSKSSSENDLKKFTFCVLSISEKLLPQCVLLIQLYLMVDLFWFNVFFCHYRTWIVQDWSRINWIIFLISLFVNKNY